MIAATSVFFITPPISALRGRPAIVNSGEHRDEAVPAPFLSATVLRCLSSLYIRA